MEEFRILGWAVDEVRELFKLVCDKNDKSLLQVFEDYAIKTNRKSLSVRNFYYKVLDLVNKDSEIASILNIEGVISNSHFSVEDTETLLRTLLKNEKNISVRRACLELANGDSKLMIRYQNKYRNALKQNPEMVEKILDELRAQNIRVRKVNFNNISVMPTPKKLITDKEIQSLFWGLVRLVKKSAEEDIELNLKQEAEFANTALQNSLIDLRRKEMLIKELKEQNKILENKLKSMENSLQESQEKMLGNMATITSLVGKSKMDELKSFIKQMNFSAKTLKK